MASAKRYRISSARLRTWDYSSEGMYFITICTKEMECFFGPVINDEMIPNEIGIIANQCWLELPNHFQNIYLREYIVMPNHVHGIIIIEKPIQHGDGVSVETRHALSLQHHQQPHFRFRNPGKNTISTMVGSYKSAVSRLVHELEPRFQWQERFHDKIIWNYDAYMRISNYIKNNPRNWKKDEFNNDVV